MCLFWQKEYLYFSKISHSYFLDKEIHDGLLPCYFISPKHLFKVSCPHSFKEPCFLSLPDLKNPLSSAFHSLLECDRNIFILSTLLVIYIVTIICAESHFCPFWKVLSIMSSDIPSPLFLQLSSPVSEALKICLFILLTFHIPQPHLHFYFLITLCLTLPVYSDLHAPVLTQYLISLSIPPSSF